MSWAENVYQCDKRTAEICTRLSINGFAFDLARAAKFTASLRETELLHLANAEKAFGRKIARTKSGNFSTKDLHLCFFKEVGAPVVLRSELTNQPSLAKGALQVYAASPRDEIREIAVSLLLWNQAKHCRGLFVQNIPVGSDLRVHPSWLNYGAVSGRWSCQGPNIMNLPRTANDPTIVWGEPDHKGRRKAIGGGIRSLYIARPGFTLVSFDAKQLEMRVAAYASGDEVMIQACESADLHAANAEVIWGAGFLEADAETRERLRSLAKSAGFAVCYLAEAETVYSRIRAAGEDVTFQAVKKMLDRLRGRFSTYFRWQDKRLYETIRTGYAATPILGRRRWLGHDPSPTECANLPIQGGAADLMNLRFPAISDAVEDEIRDSRTIAQVHDSGVFEVPEGSEEKCEGIIAKLFESPIEIKSSGKSYQVVFPLDYKRSKRWSGEKTLEAA